MLQKARRFSRQGLIRDKEEFRIKTEGSWHQEVHELGLNYRLPDILAALGSSQLSRLSLFQNKREEIFEFYSAEFKNDSRIITPTKKNTVEPFWHLYPLRVPANQRLKIFNSLKANNINVQVNYFPVYKQPVFSAEYNDADFPNALSYYQCELSLPIFTELSKSELKKITEVITNSLN
jgi:dTDP-4-amino-4,6-dideoxygalactose transaminase